MNSIINLFKNNIFRCAVLSLLLVYTFDKSPYIAIIVSLVFVITLYYINFQETTENLLYLKYFCDQVEEHKKMKKALLLN